MVTMQYVNDVSYLTIGTEYLVDCLELDRTDEVPYDERVTKYEYLPVLGPAHWDAGIDSDGNFTDAIVELHHHLDQRFMTTEEISEYGGFKYFTYNDLSETFKGITFGKKGQETVRMPKVCLRTNFLVQLYLTNIEKRYNNSKVINNRCPHHGTYLGNLEVHNNCITCPMHGLKFNNHTKKYAGYSLGITEGIQRVTD
jgi:Rieske [2Fe-2S] domain